MEKATDLNCIICCSADCEDFQGLTFHLSGEEDAEEGVKWIFKQFCSQLLSIQSLELERSLSVCSPCLESITWAVETKSKVDAVEGRVRKLQRSILMELKELQGCMASLEGELKKIEDSVKRSNGESIMFGLRRMSRMKRGQMEICEDETDAVTFRKSISDVATNLRMFCGDLSSRFPVVGFGVSIKRSASVLGFDEVNNVEEMDNFECLPSQEPHSDDCHNLEDVDSTADREEIGYGNEAHSLPDEDDLQFRNKKNKQLLLSDSDVDSNNDDDDDNSSIFPDFEQLTDVDFSSEKDQQLTTNVHMFCGNLSERFPNGASRPKSGGTDQINNGGDTEGFKSLSSQPSNYEWRNSEAENYDGGADGQEIGYSGINGPFTVSDDEDSIPPFRSKRSKKLILSGTDSDDDYDNVGSMNQFKVNSDNDKSVAQSPPPPLQVCSKTLKVLINKLGDNYSSAMKEAELGGGKRRRLSRMKSIISMKKILLSNDDHYDGDEDKDQDQNDDDYEPDSDVEVHERSDSSPRLPSVSSPVGLKKKKKKSKIKLQRNPALQQIDFTGMTSFRKYVIRGLLNNSIVQIPKPNDDEQLSNTYADSAESYLREAEQERMSAVIEYTPEVDRLHMNGVEILANEEEKTLECSECSYKFNVKWPVKAKKEKQLFIKVGKQQLKAHMLNNHHHKVFDCPLCPSGITTCYKLESYILHLKTHMNVHPYTCPICGRPLSSEFSLQLHLRTHMSTVEKEELDPILEVRPAHPCSTCGKTFRDKSHLKQHQRSHLPKELKKTILCPTCGKAIEKSYFKVHRAKFCGVLEGVPRIKCVFCEKTFKHKDLMQKHIQRTHSQDARDRPYRCHICPSSFKVKCDLSLHLKIHVEERIYKCDKGCGRDFATKRNCKRHQDNCRGARREGKKRKIQD